MRFNNAVAIARTFRMDPVAVLAETDTFSRSARIAALMLANQWDREANEKAKGKKT